MPGGSRYQQGNEVMDQVCYLASVTAPSVSASQYATSTYTMTGVQQYDLISWNLQPVPAHLAIDNIYVSAANTLTILWGTDSTGYAGGTVSILIGVTRPENANLGSSYLPSTIA